MIYRCSSKSQKIDFSSCIQVIKDNKEDIEPEVYYRYCKGMFQLTIKQIIDTEIVKTYYQQEILSRIEYVSFEQFVFLIDSQYRMNPQILKEKYKEYIDQIEITYED